MFDGLPPGPLGQRSLPAPPDGALAVELARAVRDRAGDVLFVARSGERAAQVARIARDAVPDVAVIGLPAWDSAPGDRAPPSRGVLGRRAAALTALARPAEGRGRLVLATAEAVLQRMPPRAAWRDASFRVERGMAFDEEAWRRWFAAAGYVLDERVDEPGEAAIRGSVLEVFPGDHDRPRRFDIADGRIGRVRVYDPVSQRTVAEEEAITLHPATEIVTDARTLDALARHLDEHGYPDVAALRADLEAGQRPRAFDLQLPSAYSTLESVLDWLPGAAVLLDDLARERLRARAAQVAEAVAAADEPMPGGGRARLPAPSPERLYLPLEAFEAALSGRAVTDLLPGGPEPAAPVGSERQLVMRLRERLESGAGIAAAASPPDASRLAGVLGHALGREVPVLDRWPDAPPPAGSVAVMTLRAERGFELDGVLVLPSPRTAGAGEDRETVRPPLAPAELAPDDFAVHLDYGIGRVVGLDAVEADGGATDFLVMEYAGDDRPLVPAADLDRVWRYGSSDAGARPDSLKSGAWLERRAELEREIAVTAAALAREARRRAREVAAPIRPDAARVRRFAAGFPFSATPGQERAVAAVMDAMAKPIPMDHLVCADVGYGKTEVALRAAAAAAFAGRQVAVLAPTSVLARQHLETFRRRFAGFGVAVAPLTGAMSDADACRVKEGLADGGVRIVVGTHALLSKTVAFKELGLVVVDEEQRFGAKQKQALRRRVRGVHSLALSATPIPRTLQGALAGLRGLTVIDTPPARRRPVRTLVTPDDPATLRAALRRERARGGQAFCIAPRIADLEALEARVRAAAPGMSVAVAHGRMKQAELDEVMIGFADGRTEVLVATPIIESGIDIPRANTMLLFRPDLFGLGQLHQLRGRVGRGGAQGYAYLMVDPGQPLEERTARRLGSLETIESLGGGFVLSMLDLDQRGAGDLLGAEQSGHLRAAGTELYQHLLAQALRRLRRQPDSSWQPEIHVGAPQSIPDAYIPEVELRIGLHRRLARAADTVEIDTLRDETEDRFGPLPDAVELLFDVADLRVVAKRLGVEALHAGPAGVSVTLRGDKAEARGVRMAARSGGLLRWTGERLAAALEAADARTTLANAARVLEAMEGMVRKAAARKRRRKSPLPGGGEG